jgi:AUX/IAA family
MHNSIKLLNSCKNLTPYYFLLFICSSQVVVGWPPIRTFRMNSLFNLSKDTTDQNSAKNPNTAPVLGGQKNKENEHTKEEEKKKLGNRTVSSPFVKVKMDGDPILRKIDLSSINSYKSLASVLEIMFQKPGLGSCAIPSMCSIVFTLLSFYIFFLHFIVACFTILITCEQN